METVHRNNQAAEAEVAEIPTGSTIRNIVAVPRMGTEVRRTGSAVLHVETPYPIARLVPGNRLADRVEIYPAIAPEETARAIGPMELVMAAEVVVQE
jgi:hypothetical protein